MKKQSLLALLLLGCLLLGGCRKDEEGVPTEESPVATPDPAEVVYEVEIGLHNLYDFFEYKEIPIHYKGEKGQNTTSVQMAYTLALKDVYTAANDPEKPDTLQLKFEGDIVVNRGSYTVDFDTLQVYGETLETNSSHVTESMRFWPKDDRMTMWSYGTYSTMYISYLTNFQVTEASGTVYLKYKYA